MLSTILIITLAGAPSARAVLEKYECHRCHEVEGLAPVAPAKACAGCHLEIASAGSDATKRDAGIAEYGPAFDRFIHRTSTLYVDVPPLSALTRFRASWLRGFLRDPVDLRPHLAESMPRLPIAPADLEVLVKGLAPDRPSRHPTAAQLAAGQALFETKGCTTCHLLGNRRFPSQPAALFEFKRPAISGLARAPDLRHTRQRLNRDLVVALLRKPRSVNPSATMPMLGLSGPEAEALADFVLFADLALLPAPSSEVVRTTHDGPARYEDVEQRVFRKVCWHCHSNADFAGGEGGPGNTGGFGFTGGGLSFATYEEVMNGSVGPDGEYRSIFRLGASGRPVLLEVLEQRHRENARDFMRPGQATVAPPVSSAVLGMPLGLPAVSVEDLALVEAWIAAGKPRPSTPAGSMLTPMGR